MDLDAAVDNEWKYGTPPRKRRPAAEPGTPYSPAYPVMMPTTAEARKIAAKTTQDEEDASKKKKSGTGGTRRRRGRGKGKSRKAGRRTRGRRA